MVVIRVLHMLWMQDTKFVYLFVKGTLILNASYDLSRNLQPYNAQENLNLNCFTC